MGSPLEPLPLFPLNTVLFPYARLQLHVFEPRYREMLRFCAENDTGFGIALIRSGDEVGATPDPFMVGTVARIISSQVHEDGSSDVWVQGERRFRIRHLDDSRPYLMGEVEPIVELEVEPSGRLDQVVMQAKDLLEQYLNGRFAASGMRVANMQLHDDPTVLSFMIANLLHAEPRQKQVLLEMTDTEERLHELLPLLEQQIIEADTGLYPISTEDLSEWIHRN
ncbi:MAG: LON peptidase substrate-binding domain-containing protein [Fimbriimonadaceae bacterium]|nr:LON peptidase substrate-binding domain-containing protein [Fimbriimonadaceae bacterium]